MNHYQVTCIMILTAILVSCKTSKMNNSEYVKKYYDSISYKEVYTIQKDDKVSISIWNHDELSIGSVYGVYNSNEVYGKWVLVDKNGNVPLPGLGRVNIEGLNTDMAADTLMKMYGETLRDPVISVKILNKEVSVLGEVRLQGNYVLEKEKNSIVEIISRSEGLDFYANKKNVKLIRIDSSGSKEYTLDFRNEYMPYLNELYVKPGDVIYVSAKHSKVTDKKAPMILAVASLVTATLLTLRFFGY